MRTYPGFRCKREHLGNPVTMALLIVIPTVWLLALGLVVVLCQAAARADAQQAGVSLAGATIVAARLHEPRRRLARDPRLGRKHTHGGEVPKRSDVHRRVGI